MDMQEVRIKVVSILGTTFIEFGIIKVMLPRVKQVRELAKLLNDAADHAEQFESGETEAECEIERVQASKAKRKARKRGTRKGKGKRKGN